MVINVGQYTVAKHLKTEGKKAEKDFFENKCLTMPTILNQYQKNGPNWRLKESSLEFLISIVAKNRTIEEVFETKVKHR